MECSLCAERWQRLTAILRLFGIRRAFDMELCAWTHQYYDPADSHGNGELAGKHWCCKHCGHTEEYEPDDPEPELDEEHYDEE